MFRIVLQVLVWFVAITGIVTMMLTRAHYSVDVFVAALMTPLVYTNPVRACDHFCFFLTERMWDEYYCDACDNSQVTPTIALREKCESWTVRKVLISSFI